MNSLNNINFRYYIYRNGVQVNEIETDGVPEISCVSSSELKLSFSGSFRYDESKFNNINFLKDTLRPFVYINGDETPLGEYVVTRTEHAKTSNVKSVSVEAYSLLHLASRTKLEKRKYYSSGTKYIDVIRELLIASGITKIQSIDSSAVFATDREDWEIGTSHLEIVNQLLAEINYNSAWTDLDGNIILEPFTEASAANISHIYRADEFSVIGGDYRIVNDTHDKSNVFIVTCQNPEFASPLMATAENNSPSSPYSTVNLGRILAPVHSIDNVPNINMLQSIADKLKIESMLSNETVSFTTAITPTHTINDTIALDNDDLNGIYTETGWRLPLSAGEDMTHTARRVLY